MLRIGITGGIGSGKTIVSRIFVSLGIPVFYADAEAQRLMHEDEDLRKLIIKGFGSDAYINDKLNRHYLSSIVFNNKEKLLQLNTIVHPATKRASEKWMKEQSSPYALREAALLFESGAVEGLDTVIGVYAPQALRIQRAMKRSNLTRDEVLARINKQIKEEIKMRLCDHVIINDEQHAVLPQVLKLHHKFIA